MHKKYRVTLTLAEREELERLLARGKADVRKIKHAQILLKADEAESAPDHTGLLGAARRTRPLDVAPAGAAHGRTGLRRHALLRDRAPDAQKRTPSNHT